MNSNYYIHLLKNGGFLEATQQGNTTFSDVQLNDILLYTDTPDQRILMGTDSNRPSALKITSNMVHFNQNIYVSNSINIGYSNTLANDKLIILGTSNEGPHMAIYIQSNSLYPIYRHYTKSHDDTTMCFDNNYLTSSHQGANYQLTKSNNQLTFKSSCNNPLGSNILWRTALNINSNSFITLGDTQSSFRFTILGEDKSILGPHSAIYTDIDRSNPLFQSLNWSHDDIHTAYDCFWNSNAWVSSDSNGNYRLSKTKGKFIIFSTCNTLPNTSITSFRESFTVDSNSYVGIGTSNTIQRLTVSGENASPHGPHVLFLCDSNISMQLNNWSNDFNSIGFNTYYMSNRWFGNGYSIIKNNNRLMFTSGSNTANAITITSNTFISLGSSNNPTCRLTIFGPSNSLEGPHLAMYTNDDLTYPIFQQLNEKHDGTTMGFDAYWNGTQWISSDSNGNFLIRKNNGKLNIFSACNSIPGTIIDGRWRAALVVDSNSYVGIGTSNTIQRLTVSGENASPHGPHVLFLCDSNISMQLNNWSNDFNSIGFNTYYMSNRWFGNGYSIIKNNNRLMFTSGSNTANAITITSNTFISIGSSNNPTCRLTIFGPSNSLEGPHLTTHTLDDPTYPIFQHASRRHDDIAMNFDAYWNGTQLIATNSNSFRITKSNGIMHISSSASNSISSNITFSNIISITAAGLVGINTSNPQDQIDINGQLNVRSNVKITGNILPNSNITYDLGSSNLRWKDIWLSGSSIDLDNIRINKHSSNETFTFTTSNSSNTATIWAKEILIGNPLESNNSNVFSIRTASNKLTLISSNVNISAIKTMTFMDSNITIGTSNTNNKTLYIFGEQEINIFNSNAPQSNIIRFTSPYPSNTIQRINGGYRDTEYIEGQFRPSSNVSLPLTTGFTLLTLARFTQEPIPNETIFFMSNNASQFMALNSNSFVTNEINIQFNNLFNRDEWALWTIRYTLSNSVLQVSKNNRVINTISNLPIINPKNNMIVTIGSSNTDISKLYLYDTPLETNEIGLSMININGALSISTSNASYPPFEGARYGRGRYIIRTSLSNNIIPSNITTNELYIETPSLIDLTSYTINANISTSWTVQTSLDSIKWTTIDTESNTALSSNYSVNTIHSGKHYRFNFASNITIQSISLFGNEYQLTTNEYGVTTNTTRSINTFTSDSNVIGSISTYRSTNTILYPQYPPTSSFSNAFDKSSNTAWGSALLYNFTNGSYIGSTITNVSGSNISGEWIQITLSNNILLQGYELVTSNQSSAPRSYYLIGSSNGTTWQSLDIRSNSLTWQSSSNYIVNTSSYFNTYRLIINNVTSSSNAIINEWKLYGLSNILPITSKGSHIVHGNTTTNTLELGNEMSLNSPILKCDTQSLNKYVSSACITQWDQLYQSQFNRAPIYYKDYLHFDTNSLLFTNYSNTIRDFTIIMGIRTETTGSTETLLTFGSNLILRRNPSLSLLLFDGTSSNTITPSSITFSQSNWAYLSIRYSLSNNKLIFGLNNTIYSYHTPSSNVQLPLNGIISIGGGNYDISTMYFWNNALNMATITKIIDKISHNNISLYVDSNVRIKGSLEGPVNVKTSSYYTSMDLRYPPTDMWDNETDINDQTYGNGTYTTSNTSAFNNLYIAFNAFQSNSPLGWASRSNLYSNNGIYLGSNVIFLDSNNVLGETIQITLPDTIQPTAYTIDLSSFPNPTSWIFSGSYDRLTWKSLDKQTNYIFTTSNAIFTIPLNNVQYDSYALTVLRGLSSNMGIKRLSIYGRTRNTMSITNDKIIVYDKLGINNSNPSANLHVNGTSILSGLKIVSGNSSLFTSTTSNTITLDTTSSIFRFIINNNEVTSINSNGLLMTSGPIISSNALISSPSLGINGGNGDKFIIRQGNVINYPYSIGTNLNEYWYSAPSNINYRWYINGTPHLQLNSNGLICTGTVTQSGSISDITLKKDIEPLQSSLDIIRSIKTVKYKWKKDNKPDIGLIAQNIEELIPEAVYEVESLEHGKIKAIKYERIIPIIINALQELINDDETTYRGGDYQ